MQNGYYALPAEIKKRLRMRKDTELKNFPLYCPKCKKEILIEVTNLQVTVIKEPETLDAEPRKKGAKMRLSPSRPSRPGECMLTTFWARRSLKLPRLKMWWKAPFATISAGGLGYSPVTRSGVRLKGSTFSGAAFLRFPTGQEGNLFA